MTTTLIILPTDLLTLIISYIRAPSDLRNVYRTCKALYAVAIVPIYRTMTLRLPHGYHLLAQALVPENAGLSHVRHFVLKAHTWGLNEARGDLLMPLQLLAISLPRDTLISFTLDWPIQDEEYVDSSLRAEFILETLFRRQRKLRTMRVDPSVDYSQISRFDDLANVTTFQFEILSETTAETCGRVLGNSPSLRNLEVRLRLERFDLHSPDTTSVDIVERVFDCFLKANRQIMLRALQLHGFDFALASVKLATAVDLSQLDSLGLQQCTSIVGILGKIKPNGVPPRLALRTLVLTEYDDSTGSSTVGTSNSNTAAFDVLLESFTGLENLVVAASGHRELMPGFKALNCHAAMLRLLYLDCLPISSSADDADVTDDPNVVSTSNLHLLMRQCTHLEQLALETPDLMLKYDDTEIEESMAKIAVALATAPRLRTFRPINQLVHRVNIDGYFDSNEVTRAWIDSTLQHWATKFMKSSPRLTAIGLALRRSSFEPWPDVDGFDVHPHYYVRGHQLDAYGRKSMIALRVSYEQVREIEPVSEILEMDPYGSGLLRLGYQP
ncbi:hypothetical protein KC318_g8451 [Hortaea werneckii]|uniref:F-box domain-containing protein n=1 Tax=Hortaea werneckii TaxID=91943 RepID=A0A3M6XS59_HORWE|nr:hypothetical protein KC334_g8621 [Hortaea werneckii]KAI6981610.1 hypothetical protein KC355_g10984 [Hortaea werneckii]KAI7663165.1 hypothetical protein KC318_g8451 [Hortaea werneckii]RMX93654.1 hypothetical protein D0867_14132 [Hortaea werneckii]RMY11207.1 hypothetical protein D0866_14381 [Hortaea werneckii]